MSQAGTPPGAEPDAGPETRRPVDHDAGASTTEETPLLSQGTSDSESTLGGGYGANGRTSAAAEVDLSEPKIRIGVLRAVAVAFSLWLLIFLQGKQRPLLHDACKC